MPVGCEVETSVNKSVNIKSHDSLEIPLKTKKICLEINSLRNL